MNQSGLFSTSDLSSIERAASYALFGRALSGSKKI